MKEELIDFIEWLPANSKRFENLNQEEAVEQINELFKTKEGQQEIENLLRVYKDSKTTMFKSGGKLAFLAAFKCGGKVKKGSQGLIVEDTSEKVGDKTEKSQLRAQLPTHIRKRGKVWAYPSGDSEFKDDSTWTYNNGAYIKNIFNGSTLEQHVVTRGEYGIPRKTVRIIDNYNTPATSDTSRVDANRYSYPDNPNKLQRIFKKFHSPEFKQRQNYRLEGMEPFELNEEEVKARLEKHKFGGTLPKFKK